MAMLSRKSVSPQFTFMSSVGGFTIGEAGYGHPSRGNRGAGGVPKYQIHPACKISHCTKCMVTNALTGVLTFSYIQLHSAHSTLLPFMHILCFSVIFVRNWVIKRKFKSVFRWSEVEHWFLLAIFLKIISFCSVQVFIIMVQDTWNKPWSSWAIRQISILTTNLSAHLLTSTR